MPILKSLPLALLLLTAVPGLAQAKPQYLSPTSNYLTASPALLGDLPDPPAPGSLAAQTDLETILELQAWRTEAEVAWAKQIDRLDAFDGGSAIGAWFSRANLPRCAKLLQEALGDGEAVNAVAKLKYKRLRPPFTDPRVRPCLAIYKPEGPEPGAGYYSYPSGHGTSIFLLGELLAELVPARREAVQDWARKAAWSRMQAGVHFPSDDIGGRILAGIVVRTLKANPAFRAALAGCAQEVNRMQPSQAQ